MIPRHTAQKSSELLPFLFASHPEVKRTKVRQWLKFGSVQVNGQTNVHAKFALHKGDVVSIQPKPDVRAGNILPPGMSIVFEDDSVLVIEKPENLLSMASAAVRGRTAYSYLTDYIRGGAPHSQKRIWIVHRLDRETSGLMLFAKTEAAKQTLQANWQQTEKRYQALVEGKMPEERGTMSSHLDETGPFKVYSAPESDRTRHAVTHYVVVRKTANMQLVELNLETGRRNQIRVHLADAGCPIIGDTKYDATTNPAGRLGLHANLLQFTHPVSGKVLKFDSPLPADLARVLSNSERGKPGGVKR